MNTSVSVQPIRANAEELIGVFEVRLPNSSLFLSCKSEVKQTLFIMDGDSSVVKDRSVNRRRKREETEDADGKIAKTETG